MNKELTITEFARMGGNAIKKKYGKDYFKKLAAKSVKMRKMKKVAVENSNGVHK